MPLKTVAPVENIILLEASVNYTFFHLSCGKKKLSSYTLKRYAELPEMQSFLRIHSKYLVNPKEIVSIENKGSQQYVTLSTGHKIASSRRKRIL